MIAEPVLDFKLAVDNALHIDGFKAFLAPFKNDWSVIRPDCSSFDDVTSWSVTLPGGTAFVLPINCEDWPA